MVGSISEAKSSVSGVTDPTVGLNIVGKSTHIGVTRR